MNLRTAGFEFLLATALGWSVSSIASAAACEAPAHREFDFWLGEWQVRTPDGKLAGVNRIRPA